MEVGTCCETTTDDVPNSQASAMGTENLQGDENSEDDRQGSKMGENDVVLNHQNSHTDNEIPRAEVSASGAEPRDEDAIDGDNEITPVSNITQNEVHSMETSSSVNEGSCQNTSHDNIMCKLCHTENDIEQCLTAYMPDIQTIDAKYDDKHKDNQHDNLLSLHIKGAQGGTITDVSQDRHNVFVTWARTEATLQKIEDTVDLNEAAVVVEKCICRIEEDVVDATEINNEDVMNSVIEKNKDFEGSCMNKNEDIMDTNMNKTEDILDASMNKNEDMYASMNIGIEKNKDTVDSCMNKNEDFMDTNMTNTENIMDPSINRNEDIMPINTGVYNDEDTMDYADFQFLTQPSRTSPKRKLALSSDLPALKRCHTC